MDAVLREQLGRAEMADIEMSLLQVIPYELFFLVGVSSPALLPESGRLGVEAHLRGGVLRGLWPLIGLPIGLHVFAQVACLFFGKSPWGS